MPLYSLKIWVSINYTIHFQERLSTLIFHLSRSDMKYHVFPL